MSEHFLPLPDHDAAAALAAAEQVADALDPVTRNRIDRGAGRDAVVAAILDRQTDASLFTPPAWDGAVVAAAIDAAIDERCPDLIPDAADLAFASWIAAAATAAVHAADLPWDAPRLRTIVGDTLARAQRTVDVGHEGHR